MELTKRNKIIFAIIAIILLWLIIAAMLYLNYKQNLYHHIQDHRNLAYEYYCDSIWENDPNYYEDVLMENDEYINYIDEHGEWWHK